MVRKLQEFDDWGLFLLRLAVGIVFLFHGVQKFSFWSAPPSNMAPGMILLFQVLSIVEPLAGLMLLLGVLTEWAALVLAVIMIGAIFFKSQVMNIGFASQRGTGWEFDLVLLATSAYLFLRGGGAIALDMLMGLRGKAR